MKEIYIRNKGLDGHSGGVHPFSFRTRKLSPPAFHLVLWCSRPWEFRIAVRPLFNSFFNVLTCIDFS